MAKTSKQIKGTREDIIDDFYQVLQKWLQEKGSDKEITRTFYRKFGKYSESLYNDLFGSFKQLKEEVLSNFSFEDIENLSKLDKIESVHIDDNTHSISLVSKRILTLDDLLAIAKVDLEKYYVNKYKVNKWEVGAKNASGIIVVSPLFQVKADIEKKIRDIPKFKLPEPVIFNVEKVSLPSVKNNKNKIKRSIIIGDAQIGYERDFSSGSFKAFHDCKAMDVVLQVVEQEKPDEVIIIGDMLDHTEASKFLLKKEYYFTLQPSINTLGYYFSRLRIASPNSKIIYMIGNHEYRMAKKFMEHMMFAYDIKAYDSKMPVMSLKNLLGLDKLGIEVMESYPNDEYWINDYAKCVHGEYLKMTTALNNHKITVIQGHLHRNEMISKTVHDRYGSDTMTVCSIPCLCKLDGIVPSVKSKENWQNGFCYVESFNENIDIHNILVSAGKCLFNGNFYEGKDFMEGKDYLLKV